MLVLPFWFSFLLSLWHLDSFFYASLVCVHLSQWCKWHLCFSRYLFWVESVTYTSRNSCERGRKKLVKCFSSWIYWEGGYLLVLPKSYWLTVGNGFTHKESDVAFFPSFSHYFPAPLPSIIVADFLSIAILLSLWDKLHRCERLKGGEAHLSLSSSFFHPSISTGNYRPTFLRRCRCHYLVYDRTLLDYFLGWCGCSLLF